MRVVKRVLAVLVAGAAVAAAGCATGGAGSRGPGASGGAEQTAGAARPFDLPYGLAAEPRDGDIVHVATGVPVSREQLLDVLEGARVVYVGETHDNVHAHRVQLEIIRELERRHPGRVAIGMEMFREPQQGVLDRWVRGELTEEQFLAESRWYEVWSSDYGYYREILDLARERRLDVLALNPPRELQQEVSKAGIDRLPPEVAARLPEIGPLDPWQRESLKAVFGAHLRTEGMLDSFLRVQSLWEETMASRAASYLGGPRGEGKRLVVLAGGWHVRNGFGMPKKLFRRLPLPYAIVLPEEISVPEAKRESVMDVDLPEIPLYPADFLWFVPYEDLEMKRPRMGVLLAERDGKVLVEKVVEGSPAARAGIAAGDAVAAVDGIAAASAGDVQAAVRRRSAGDAVTVRLRREGVERTVTVVLEVAAPQKEHGKQP